MTYYTRTNPVTGMSYICKLDGDILTLIPEDKQNSDYQAYLAWLAEGNTPEPWPPANQP